MTGKSAWMTGSMLCAILALNSTAIAQSQPRYSAPEAQDEPEIADQPIDGQDYAAEPEPEGDPPSQRPANERAEDDFSDVVAADERRASPLGLPPADEQDIGAGTTDEDEEAQAMTDDCARAAREEAEREGDYAEVRRMEAPRESRNGYSIDGDVESRSHWRAQDGRLRHFTCTIANGRIQGVYFPRERAARGRLAR